MSRTIDSFCPAESIGQVDFEWGGRTANHTEFSLFSFESRGGGAGQLLLTQCRNLRMHFRVRGQHGKIGTVEAIGSLGSRERLTPLTVTPVNLPHLQLFQEIVGSFSLRDIESTAEGI